MIRKGSATWLHIRLVKPVFNLLPANGYIFENKSKGNRVFLARFKFREPLHAKGSKLH